MQIRCCNRQDMIHDNMLVGEVIYVLDQQKIYMVVEDGFLEVCNYDDVIAREFAKEDGWRPRMEAPNFSQNNLSKINQSIRQASEITSMETASVPDIPPLPEIAR